MTYFMPPTMVYGKVHYFIQKNNEGYEVHCQITSFFNKENLIHIVIWKMYNNIAKWKFCKVSKMKNMKIFGNFLEMINFNGSEALTSGCCAPKSFTYYLAHAMKYLLWKFQKNRKPVSLSFSGKDVARSNLEKLEWLQIWITFTPVGSQSNHFQKHIHLHCQKGTCEVSSDCSVLHC